MGLNKKIGDVQHGKDSKEERAGQESGGSDGKEDQHLPHERLSDAWRYASGL